MGCYKNEWNEYMLGTKLKYFTFLQWKLKTIFSESILPGPPISKNMTRHDFILEFFPRNELELIVILTN